MRNNHVVDIFYFSIHHGEVLKGICTEMIPSFSQDGGILSYVFASSQDYFSFSRLIVGGAGKILHAFVDHIFKRVEHHV